MMKSDLEPVLPSGLGSVVPFVLPLSGVRCPALVDSVL